MRRTGGIALVGIFCHSGFSHAHYTAVVDLSYKSHLKAATLANAIRDAVGSVDEPPNVVELDVSFSELGNDGLAIVLESLLVSKDSLALHLAARMNRLTPEGVSNLLTTILKDDNETASDEDPASNPLMLESLDLGWNNLSPDQAGTKPFLSSLRKLVEDPKRCPRLLRLYRCGLGPAACRALGKGIMKRFETTPNAPPLSLHLCGNEAIGDAGTAALAAAIRSSSNGETIIMDDLDLSSCNVGDAGAEALALAIERGCVGHLNLSNNKISNDGAASIGQGLLASLECKTCCESIDLSNNHEIGDEGAASLAAALEGGVVRNVVLRSCQIHADGAKALGSVLVALSKSKQESVSIKVDLSGNPLGVLRGKKKSEGGKYSASNLKSKASATTASYMNFIGRKIQQGLKDSGFGGSAASGESDDEEDERMGYSQDKDKSDASKARCGAKAFASAVVVGDDHDDEPVVEAARITCHLGVRHCFLDRGGADALAATVLQAKQRLGVELVIDARMNPVLEENMVEALRGDDPDTLEEMAERHMSVLETLRIAEERAVEAAAAAAARRREEAEWESDYGGLDLDPYAEEDDDAFDSDAKYDDYEDEDEW